MTITNQALMGKPFKIRKRGLLAYKTRKKLVPFFYVAPAAFLFFLLMLFPMI